VTLLRGEQATWAQPAKPRAIPFTTTADLRAQLKAARDPDAIFHAAAVSDFAFGKVWQRTSAGDLNPIASGKISSLLENLFAELVPTPKIIRELRDWHPNAFLVGWKFEVEGNRESALAQARRQLAECRVNACVANGPAYGEGFAVVSASVQHCHSKEDLFNALLAILPKRAQ
jgi:phosphopantothenoylcysteine decarboxylase/phosphopantothenate--cysteine ligase